MRGLKKILRVILALLSVSVLMIGSCLTVFASESETMTYDEWASTLDFSNISFAEPYEYITCFWEEGGAYILYAGHYPTYVGSVGSYRVNCNLLDDGNFGDSGRGQYFVSSNGSDWTFKFYVNDSRSVDLLDHEHYVYRNHDIKDYSGNVVFPLPVRPLVRVAQMITPEMILGQIVGLLPLLILFVVGLAAFWKGWQVLSNTLRQA